MLHHLIGKWVLILYQSDTPSYSSTITLPRPVGKHTRLFNLLSCHGQRIHKRPIGRCPDQEDTPSGITSPGPCSFRPSSPDPASSDPPYLQPIRPLILPLLHPELHLRFPSDPS